MREQAVFCIDPVNDPSQLSNRGRSAPPFCRQFRRNGSQPRRSKRLPFESLQDPRKEKESFGITRDPVNDCLRSLFQSAQKNGIHSEKDQRDPIGSAREVVEDGRDRAKRESNSDSSPRRFRKNSLPFAPANHRSAIRSGPQTFDAPR